MDGAKTVVTEISTSMTLPKVNNLVKLDEYTMFELDSFTKCSIFKRPKDECLYEKNTHFGWMICGENVLKNLADSQIKMAENNIGKEIMLNDIGHRNGSTRFHQNDLK